MEDLIFYIIIIVLLIVIIVLQFLGKKETDIGRIESLTKQCAKEQRDEIHGQLSLGASEQFKRFDEIGSSLNSSLQAGRMETNDQLGNFSEQIQKALQRNREEGSKQFRDFQDHMVSTLGLRMKSLQDSNEKRLEQMQGIVDEKLQQTLETRLSQSFDLVSEQLDNVQQGLGEMRNLAADAKSLKHALTNVKERGTYGEIRLEKLLADILAPSQYESNVEIADNRVIEFGIKLPGQGDAPLLLPIDSKFPIEDYNRLVDAVDKTEIEEARRTLLTRIRVFAKNIHDNYILPPKTTDFALMFLPTEGLYAEVVRNVSLFEELRDKYQVTVVGVTTLSAFLSSLQMGFKTLAIEQRSQEVWDTLRAVKAEFTKFDGILEKAHHQLQTADKTLETIVGTRTRAINRALREVEELKVEEIAVNEQKKIEGDQLLKLESTPAGVQMPEKQVSEVYIPDFQMPPEIQMPELQISDSQLLDQQVLDRQLPDAQLLGQQVLDRQLPDAQLLGQQVLDRQLPDAQLLDKQVLDRQLPDGQLLDKQVLDRQLPDAQLLGQQVSDGQILDQQMFDRQLPDAQLLDQQILDRQLTDGQLLDQQILDRQLPDAQKLDQQILDRQALDRQTPVSQLLDQQVSDSQILESQILESQILESQILEKQIPEVQMSEKHMLDRQVSENQMPERQMPDIQMPEIQIPNVKLPDLPEIKGEQQLISLSDIEGAL